MRRLRLLAVLVVSALLAAGCGTAQGSTGTSGASGAATPPGRSVGTSVDQALPAAIFDLPFTSSTGATVRLRDFAGKVVALSDVMTLCQETCPLDTATFVQTDRDEVAARRGQPTDEVFLSITVDPARDTTAQLAAYRHLFTSPPSNWLALTGPAASVNALWDFLGVWRQKVPEPSGPPPKNWRTGQALTYDVQHSDEVFFLDRAGHERYVLEGPPYATRGSIPGELYGFLDSAGKRNVAHPASTDWTESQARQVLAWLRS
jgi:protein SCO1/2